MDYDEAHSVTWLGLLWEDYCSRLSALASRVKNDISTGANQAKQEFVPTANQVMKDFLTGASFVHNNYLSLYARHNTLARAATLGIFIVPQVIKLLGGDDLWYLRQAVMATLLVQETVGNVVSLADWWVFTTPLQSFTTIATLPFKSLSRLVSFAFSYADVLQQSVSQLSLVQYVSKVATGIGLPFFLDIIKAPIAEEIVHRWFPAQIKKEIFGDKDGVQDKESRNNPRDGDAVSFWCRPILFGCSPWTLASGSLFGLAHVGNYTGGLRNLSLEAPSLYLDPSTLKSQNDAFEESKEKAIRLVGGALYQSTAAFVGAITMLEPIYDKYGLIAAIGAHAAWNFYAGFTHSMMAACLGMHALKCLRQRTAEQARLQVDDSDTAGSSGYDVVTTACGHGVSQ